MCFKAVTEIGWGIESAFGCNFSYGERSGCQIMLGSGKTDVYQILVWSHMNIFQEQLVKIGNAEAAVVCDFLHSQRFCIGLLHILDGILMKE